MLEFSDDFFKEEVLCGFEVSEEMKRVWAAEMKVLSEVIRVCDKYNIVYYADYGTLLGAVRHKGFIPWDDDMDICLKRKDYLKLIEVLPDELPEYYSVNSCYTKESHRQPWSSVANYQQFPIPEFVKKEFYDCPYVVGVDLYMLDYVPRDDEQAELLYGLYGIVYDAAYRFEEFQENGELEKYLIQIEELCNVKLKRDDTLRNQLLKLDENIAAMFKEEECDDMTFLPRVIQGGEDFRYKKEWYNGYIKMPFYGMELNVPKDYKKVLENYYGDYSICVPDVSSHEYPFYKKQKEWLEQHR